MTRLKAGDRVAGIPLIPCGRCAACGRGEFSLCAHYSFIGSRRQGSFAEYVAAPEANAFPIGGVSYEQGALFEPAAVALHGLLRGGYRGGGRVAILGGGTIGLFTLQWARAYGAGRVDVFDIAPARLALARDLGSDAVFNTAGPAFEEEAQRVAEAGGYDYVYETAGSTETIRLALRMAGNRGRVCLIGTPARDPAFTAREWELINRKELCISGSWMGYSAPFPGREWELTAAFFADGRLRVHPDMLHGVLPLSRIDEAFQLYRTPGAVKGKILIDSEA